VRWIPSLRTCSKKCIKRPGDDLEIIHQAWPSAWSSMRGKTRLGRALCGASAGGRAGAGGAEDGSTAIAAGLLHDAVEDTDVTTGEIEKRFGEQVAHIVEGVTKLDKIKFANREDHQAENIRKMLLAMVTDVRVVLIKLADRLHNMRTLEHLAPEKRQKISRETLDIYAPLAHRLGMGKLRGELEDLAFRYTDSFAYEQLSTEVDALRARARSFSKASSRRWKANCASTRSTVAWSGASSASTPSSRNSPSRRYLWTRSTTCWPSASSASRCRLLRGAGSAALHLAAGAGAHQGLHRNAAAQPLPEPAFHADRAWRTPSSRCRSAPKRCIASPRRHRRALEIQGRRQRQRQGRGPLAWVRQLMEWQREMSDPNSSCPR